MQLRMGLGRVAANRRSWTGLDKLDLKEWGPMTRASPKGSPRKVTATRRAGQSSAETGSAMRLSTSSAEQAASVINPHRVIQL